MNSSQNMQQIDDLQILKEKILKIDSIFKLISERQIKIDELESKNRRLQNDNNVLQDTNNKLSVEYEKLQKDQERSATDYEGKLLEENQKYSELECTIATLKKRQRDALVKCRRKFIVKFKKCLLKRINQSKENADKTHSKEINKLRGVIKYLHRKLREKHASSDSTPASDEKSKPKIKILQNVVISLKAIENEAQKESELEEQTEEIKEVEEEEEDFDLENLLHEMISLPNLISPLAEERLQSDAMTQTIKSTVTRPVQTNSLITSTKATQTRARSSHIDIQCDLPMEKSKKEVQSQTVQTDVQSVAKDAQSLNIKKNVSVTEVNSRSVQTVVHSSAKDTQTMNLRMKSTSSQTTNSFVTERRITLKQAVIALKKSRKTFTISNGMLIHYSNNPMPPSSNESLIARTVFRQLTKYIDKKYSKTDGRRRRRATNILNEIKHLERNRELMNFCKSGTSCSTTSDTESSGYDCRALQRARCLEDLLMDGQTTPSGDSGILSEVEVEKPKTDKDRVSDILDEMLVDLPSILSPIESQENTEPTAIVEAKQPETVVDKRQRKRPVSRLTLLKKGIKKCNQVGIRKTVSVEEDNASEDVSLTSKKIRTASTKLHSEANQNISPMPVPDPKDDNKHIAPTIVEVDTKTVCKPIQSTTRRISAADILSLMNHAEHNYATTNSISQENPSEKLTGQRADCNTNKILDKYILPVGKSVEFDTLCVLDVARNVTITPEDIVKTPPEDSDKEVSGMPPEEKEITTTENSTTEIASSSITAKRKRGRPRKSDTLKVPDVSIVPKTCTRSTRSGRNYNPPIATSSPIVKESIELTGEGKCKKRKLDLKETTQEEHMPPSGLETPKTETSSIINLDPSAVNVEFRKMRQRCIQSMNVNSLKLQKSEDVKCAEIVPAVVASPSPQEIKPRLKADDILSSIPLDVSVEVEGPASIVDLVPTMSFYQEVPTVPPETRSTTREQSEIPHLMTTRSGRSYVGQKGSPENDKTNKYVPRCHATETKLLEMKEKPTEKNIEEEKSQPKVTQVTKEPKQKTNITFKQMKSALDKFVWYRGDKRVCQPEVELLKEVPMFKLVNFIVQYLDKDQGELEKPNGSTSMEPLLTSKQKIVFGFLVQIDREVADTDYVSQVITHTEKYLLFSKKRNPEVLENMSRFYAALCRFRHRKHRVRMFLADLLYERPTQSFVIIYTIVTSWLNVMQRYKDNSSDIGFGHVLAHITFSQPNKPTMCVAEDNEHDNCIGVLKNLLAAYYKFPKEQDVDDLMMSLLESYMCGGEVQFESALLILCNNGTPEWTYGKAQLIGELCKVSEDDEVVRNLFQLIAKIGKKADNKYKTKIQESLTELFSHFSSVNNAIVEDLKYLCIDAEQE